MVAKLVAPQRALSEEISALSGGLLRWIAGDIYKETRRVATGRAPHD